MPDPSPISELTLLLNGARAAEAPLMAATDEELLPLVYDELRRLAAHQMAGESGDHTLQPTALVHEAWLRLGTRRGQAWNDRLHFFRTAVRTMRRILVDRARRRTALRHADPRRRVDLADLDLASAPPDDRVLLVDSALQELERTDPDSARLIDLKFFGGFTNREIAWMQGVSERTIERRWLYARARVFRLMEAEAC